MDKCSSTMEEPKDSVIGTIKVTMTKKEKKGRKVKLEVFL
jgi:hypothetical protein